MKRCRSSLRVRSVFIAAALLCFALGCHLLSEEPIHLDIEANAYPPDSKAPVKRVLVLPFANETSYDNQEGVVQKAFALELAQRGLFEVVSLPEEDQELLAPVDSYTKGRISTTLLMELGDYYRVDAVLLGCLKRYNPYPPYPIIGLKADLVSVHDGKVLRTVDGLLDSGDADVARDLKRYHQRESARQESLLQWERVTASPDAYARYASHRLLEAMYPEHRAEEARL